MTETSAEGQPKGLAKDLASLPTDRVVQISGVTADDIALTLAQQTASLPAGLIHRVSSAATLDDLVNAVLDDLESVAIGLFPSWLPGAEHLQFPGGAGLVAVRALAAAHATRSAHFGPFFTDLAAKALAGKPTRRRRFTPERRARGLARVIADALRRDRLILVIDVRPGLPVDDELVLAAGCAWLADHGRFGLWLTGTPLRAIDWLANTTLIRPPEPAESGQIYPAVVGAPHPRSAAEGLLEAALATRAWAAGRHWNQTYQPHVLRSPVRLDLLWRDERCVVEIDGPEHCEPARFDADRRRDVQLQLDGYAVLRFTNARVLYDVDAVVTQIGQFIMRRRQENRKGTAWAATT
jgi:very-short-patch-repair endonuclease